MQIAIGVDGGSCLGTIYWNGKATVMMVDVVEVAEDRRHTGVGMVLMDEVFAVAERNGVDSVELLVNADNEAAKGLYRKVGFEHTTKEHHRLLLRRF